LRYDVGMQDYRKSSHTTYLLNYHFIFIPKYRKPALRGDVALRVRELIREICRSHNIEILKGHVRPDHVHLLLSVPPNLAPSRVMQAIKGKTSHHLLQEFRRLRKEFWGRHLWARGYFVATSGNVTDEVISKYIELQGVEPQDDDVFKVSE
jgi:putative transposase